MNYKEELMKVLKQVYIKIGKGFFQIEEKLHIQKIENGYVFSCKYYKDIDSMIPDFKEKLKDYFDEK